MADTPLDALLKTLRSARHNLKQFASAENYRNVPYSYYHAEPRASVPDDVWRYIADDEGIAYEKLDIFPDRTAGLCWHDENYDVRKFKVLCKRCCAAIWDHANLLATVAECRTAVGMASGYHQWVRMIHDIAGGSPVWSGLVNRYLFISQRPFEETKKEREIEWTRELPPDDIAGEVCPVERSELEEQLVRKLNDQGVSVPDVWFEHIPRTIAKFHCQMLEVLVQFVECGCPPQTTHSKAAEAGDVDTEVPCLVTLFQAAAIVHRSKRTLAKYKSKMPAPSVPGGHGMAAYWDWPVLRPWLEKKFGMILPPHFPGDRVRPHSS